MNYFNEDRQVFCCFCWFLNARILVFLTSTSFCSHHTSHKKKTGLRRTHRPSYALREWERDRLWQWERERNSRLSCEWQGWQLPPLPPFTLIWVVSSKKGQIFFFKMWLPALGFLNPGQEGWMGWVRAANLAGLIRLRGCQILPGPPFPPEWRLTNLCCWCPSARNRWNYFLCARLAQKNFLNGPLW